jgi:hypothetical protein
MRTLTFSALVTVIAVVAAPSRAAFTPTKDPLGDVQAPPDQTLVVTLPDGVAVTLEPGTRGRWLPRGKLPSETNRWAVGYHLMLVDGELDVRMPAAPKGSHAFLVQTRAGTLTDWRGALHVAVHDQTTTAAIYEGALVVGSNGQGFPVYDGAGILMRNGIDPDKSRGIPPAPAWDAEHGAPSLLVEPAGTHGTVGFSWKAIPGVASYRVELARDAEMTQLVELATTTDTTYAMVERGPESGYWTRVRAVGSDGIVGEWSRSRSLRVLHYALPDGAVVARDGAVVLAPGTSIALANADGLELAYGTTTPTVAQSYWSPLGGPLRLPGDADMRVVHLRDPVLGQETTLTLARRALRADVQITPRDPRPGDPVQIRVVAWDPTGHLDPARETVSLETTLDLDPLPVAWRQEGSTWTAVVHPRPALRPTVVRVAAKDAYGQEIGRGFVEIESSR